MRLVATSFFPSFKRPGADKHSHKGTNIVTGCAVATSLTCVHAASVCVCEFTLLDVHVCFSGSTSSFHNWCDFPCLCSLTAQLKYTLRTDRNNRKNSIPPSLLLCVLLNDTRLIL